MVVSKPLGNILSHRALRQSGTTKRPITVGVRSLLSPNQKPLRCTRGLPLRASSTSPCRPEIYRGLSLDGLQYLLLTIDDYSKSVNEPL